MLSSRNFDPDWGRFVPSPNYRAILTAVFVATAIGATGSAAVVLVACRSSNGRVGYPVDFGANQSSHVCCG